MPYYATTSVTVVLINPEVWILNLENILNIYFVGFEVLLP